MGNGASSETARHVMKIMESTMRSSHFGGWATAFIGFILWGRSTGAAHQSAKPDARVRRTDHRGNDDFSVNRATLSA
jgi:hypothetical protein